MIRIGNVKTSSWSRVIIGSLLVILLLIATVLSYQRQRALIRKVARAEARIVAGEVLEIMAETRAVFPAEGKPVISHHHQPAELQRVVNRITAPDKFLIRILAFGQDNAIYRPDESELRLMQRLKSGRADETHLFMKKAGEWVLLYLRPMKADPPCLGCHGPFESAPAPVRAHFPRGSSIYDRTEGEVMGAVAVVMPMKELHGEVRKNVLSGFIFMVLLVITLGIGPVIRRVKGRGEK